MKNLGILLSLCRLNLEMIPKLYKVYLGYVRGQKNILIGVAELLFALLIFFVNSILLNLSFKLAPIPLTGEHLTKFNQLNY